MRHSCCQARAWERKEAGYLIVADHLGLRLRPRARFAPTGGLPVTSGGTNIQTKPYDKGGSIFGCREGLFFGCHLQRVPHASPGIANIGPGIQPDFAYKIFGLGPITGGCCCPPLIKSRRIFGGNLWTGPIDQGGS